MTWYGKGRLTVAAEAVPAKATMTVPVPAATAMTRATLSCLFICAPGMAYRWRVAAAASIVR
ncbi:hypothetical protein Raf01_66650 [Rugosimonospora africana]|uniref:Uncharacterized protein n=1 Tax=Rugosimonospora africana TaxID=556532 RepID=A0A8J3VUD0_9ACTN|nr:hypothetical protein Raf01_66650 [Rugosimonospora africana]